ncbi:hypothetical protein [Streptomyces sp. NPDC087538]|uniref:hypothetical protein n=1 Tax=Streptomyces sp. NPDC087538 TaxID=3365797 RepID=UPI0038125A00
MSTGTLYSRRRADVRRFRDANGDITGWSADRFEIYLDLIRVARIARWHWLRTIGRRTGVLAAVAYITPLYVLAELTGTWRGEMWQRLDAHLWRMDRKLTAAELVCGRAGDHAFIALVTRAIDRITSTVGRLTARITRG